MGSVSYTHLNCEAEVDQMVLEFPVMADYCILAIDGKTLYATHGHVYNHNNLPPLCEGDILIHGHTPVSYTHLDVYKRQGYLHMRELLQNPYMD